MTLDGRKRIVRESDGIHLNAAGAGLAAEKVLEAVRRDFGGVAHHQRAAARAEARAQHPRAAVVAP